MPLTAEGFFEGLGTLLKVGGGLNSANKSADGLDKTATSYRQAGDNALIVSGMNSAAYRKLGDNALVVGQFNSKQYEMRADQFRKKGTEIARKGVAEENDLRSEVARIISSQRAGYAAGGVIINRGTPAAMQIGTARAGEVDALRIRDNYLSLLDDNDFEIKQSLGQAELSRIQGQQQYDAAYNTAAIIDTEGGFAKAAAYNSATAMEREGDNMENASYLDAAGNLISSPVAQKWLIDAFKGLGGGSGPGTMGGTGGIGIPAPTGGGASSPTWGTSTAGQVVLGAGATVVGGYAGQKLGEEITNRQVNSNWGAGFGGAAGYVVGAKMGATYGGVWGALIGAAIGGLVDAFSGGRSYSHNSGFFLKDLPAVQNDGDREKFTVEPFDSGLQPVGFTRRTDKEEATTVIDAFRGLDKIIFETGKEFGKTITADYVTGLDEKGQGSGAFIGMAGEDGQPGKLVSDQMEQYGTELLQSLQGQVSEEGYARIMAAPTVEDKIKTMREVLAAEAE
jgi:hypothetical protein